jgi:phosphate transport system substrate-binding protein
LRVVRSWLRPAFPIVTAIALVLAACSSPTESQGGAGSSAPADGGGVEGFVSVHGSSTVEPITSAVAGAFADANPGFDFEVGGEGTGDGFASFFCTGESDISDASRAINEEEVAECVDAGVEFTELRIGYDGITVMTSPDNADVSCLSFLDLYALLGPESEGFTSWSDANDLAAELEDAGLGTSNAPYPDATLDISGPGEESGTYDSFIELALGDIAEARVESGDITEDEAGTTRPDYGASADDNVIVQGVEGSSSSLGWVGFAYFEENASALKAIEIDGGDGCVAVSTESIADGSYPISRPLFIYVNNAKADENAALASFVGYFLGDGYDNVSGVGYVGLPDDQLAETVAAWEGR